MKKAVIVYYSMDGNTKLIADQIQNTARIPIVRLDTVIPYTGSDDEIIAQGQDEVNRHYKPKLKPLGFQPDDYDTFIVGTPTWWYTMASPVLSFLSSISWKGKTIIPFQTHAGWPGHGLDDIKRNCPDAVIRFPKTIHFSPEQFGKMETSQQELDEWINEVKKYLEK